MIHGVSRYKILVKLIENYISMGSMRCIGVIAFMCDGVKQITFEPQVFNSQIYARQGDLAAK